MRRHTIILALMVALMAVAFPLTARVASFVPENRSSGPTGSCFANNVDPSVHFDMALDLKTDSVAWSREYCYQNHWDWNNGSMALPGHWPRPTSGPHWGLALHGFYDAPTNRLSPWGGAFIGSQNLKFYCLTDLNHPGRRWGLGFRFFY